jgi:hypothetical protein
VCLGDAFDDCQAEADAWVVDAYAIRAALKRLDKRRNQLPGEFLTGVLYPERHMLGVDTGRNPNGALFRQVVDDRVVHEVRTQLQQERLRAEGGGHVTGDVDGDAAFFREGEERFSGFFCYEGQVDVFWDEGSLVSATEEEQCFSEVDRSGINEVEAVDKFAGVAVRIVAGYIEKCPRDRQWCAQFVRGIGCESPLFGDLCFEPCEHGVEGVGEFAELVSTAR